ncbi:MAG: phosphoribosylformylglycinamidine cyclo-ligase [Chloroflexi bacterium]|nr:phosphoribosylformylglycinamidine cyclo-ligase [Chloroflexota bacterium]
MADQELLRRITADPEIFAGKPIVRGLRVSVESVLSLLAQGETVERILADYPGLEPEDIRACLAYAHAAVARDSLDTANAGRSLTYSSAGVDTDREERALSGLIRQVAPTLELRRGLGEARLPIGFFANVLDLGNNLGLAISTDGVGTKLLVAQMMDRYATIGIDCIAMNVNDVLCVGAEPLSLVDYIAVQEANPHLLEEIAKGLARGAEVAGINIPGGEIAQVKEIVQGYKPGYAFDLVGTAVGLVRLDRMILGQNLQDGDVIVGLRSSGIHSNGLTLARKVLFDGCHLSPSQYSEELGETIGEALLEPTRIYVREVLAMLQSGVEVKGLAHITGDGLLNLLRLDSEVEYVIDSLPEPHPIFALIQQGAGISDGEMFRTFNMGIGFCVVVAPGGAEQVISIARSHGGEAAVLGHTAKSSERKVLLMPKGLAGIGHEFHAVR